MAENTFSEDQSDVDGSIDPSETCIEESRQNTIAEEVTDKFKEDFRSTWNAYKKATDKVYSQSVQLLLKEFGTLSNIKENARTIKSIIAESILLKNELELYQNNERNPDGVGANKEKRRVNQPINRYFNKIIDIVNHTLNANPVNTLNASPVNQADDSQPNSTENNAPSIASTELQSSIIDIGEEDLEIFQQIPTIGAGEKIEDAGVEKLQSSIIDIVEEDLEISQHTPTIGADEEIEDTSVENLNGQNVEIEANEVQSNIGTISEGDLMRLRAGGPVTRRMAAILAAAVSKDQQGENSKRNAADRENNQPLFTFLYNEQDTLAEEVCSH